MNLQDVIVKPIITEKAMNEAGQGKFTFAVQKHATKTIIKKAINAIFKVNIVKIQTNMIKGKTKRIGMRRNKIEQSEWKKAVVTLKKGEKIDLFEANSQSK